MKPRILKRSRDLKHRIGHRLRPIDWEHQSDPMFSATNIHYEVAQRVRGLDVGGVGAIHLLVQRLGLPAAINEKLRLLKEISP